MMLLSPVRTVAPADLITVEAAKIACGLPASANDDSIARSIKAATTYLEVGILGKAVLPQTWAVSGDAWPCDRFWLPFGPLREIESITYINAEGDEVTINEDDYTGHQDGRDPFITWRDGYTAPTLQVLSNAFTVTWIAGFPDGSDDIDLVREAVLLRVRHQQSRLKRDAALETDTVYGVGSRSYATDGTADAVVDRAIRSLVGHLARRDV